MARPKPFPAKARFFAVRASLSGNFLDAAGVPTTFYDLPCNYPPSPSKHKHHRCIAGMGVPDMLGTYGTYQQFAEDGPVAPPAGRACR